jgi:hypothetical protein
VQSHEGPLFGDLNHVHPPRIKMVTYLFFWRGIMENKLISSEMYELFMNCIKLSQKNQ